jgi:hypothetical protein
LKINKNGLYTNKNNSFPPKNHLDHPLPTKKNTKNSIIIAFLLEKQINPNSKKPKNTNFYTGKNPKKSSKNTKRNKQRRNAREKTAKGNQPSRKQKTPKCS